MLWSLLGGKKKKKKRKNKKTKPTKNPTGAGAARGRGSRHVHPAEKRRCGGRLLLRCNSYTAAFCSGMLGEEQHPDISLDKCLSACFPPTLACFAYCLLPAFHPNQELCYIKIKATTATIKGTIHTSKTVRINAC